MVRRDIDRGLDRGRIGFLGLERHGARIAGEDPVPFRDKKPVRARYLKVSILEGTPGLWEFRVY